MHCTFVRTARSAGETEASGASKHIMPPRSFLLPLSVCSQPKSHPYLFTHTTTHTENSHRAAAAIQASCIREQYHLLCSFSPLSTAVQQYLLRFVRALFFQASLDSGRPKDTLLVQFSHLTMVVCTAVLCLRVCLSHLKVMIIMYFLWGAM